MNARANDQKVGGTTIVALESSKLNSVCSPSASALSRDGGVCESKSKGRRSRWCPGWVRRSCDHLGGDQGEGCHQDAACGSAPHVRADPGTHRWRASHYRSRGRRRGQRNASSIVRLIQRSKGTGVPSHASCGSARQHDDSVIWRGPLLRLGQRASAGRREVKCSVPSRRVSTADLVKPVTSQGSPRPGPQQESPG